MTPPEAVAAFFAAEDWSVDVDEASGVTSFAAQADSGEWYGQVWWLDATEQLLVYSVLPYQVPQGQRIAVALVINRINAVLVVGSFEIDLADGQVRLRTGVSVAADAVTPDVVGRAVSANVHTMQRYLPALVQVTAGANPLTVDLPG